MAGDEPPSPPPSLVGSRPATEDIYSSSIQSNPIQSIKWILFRPTGAKLTSWILPPGVNLFSSCLAAKQRSRGMVARFQPPSKVVVAPFWLFQGGHLWPSCPGIEGLFKIFSNTGVKIASSYLDTTRLTTLYWKSEFACLRNVKSFFKISCNK